MEFDMQLICRGLKWIVKPAEIQICSIVCRLIRFRVLDSSMGDLSVANTSDTNMFYCKWIDLDQGYESEPVWSQGGESVSESEYWTVLFVENDLDEDVLSMHGLSSC